MDKAELRRSVRAQGPATGIDHRARCAALRAFLDGRVADGSLVVVYDALDDEVRLDDLVASHPRPRDRFAVTRTPDHGRVLTVHPWGGPTEVHRYGYRQPRADAPSVPDERIGAVIVPGLAFDRLGHRLGRGAGYYDRFLARLGAGVLRIGITARPLVDRVPVEDHDVAMTHLAIAEGIVAVDGTDGTGSGPDRP